MIATWDDYRKAAKALLDGELVTFPTETVYGVGCVFDDETAFQKLVDLKKRPPNKPFAMMCDSLESAERYLDCSADILALLRKFLPGEFTFLLNGANNLPSHVTLGTGVMGLRVPDSEPVRKMLQAVGKGCLVTSANISGKATAKAFEELDKVFVDETFLIRGECVSLLPSTIIDLSKGEPILLRQGKMPFATVLDYWRSIKG